MPKKSLDELLALDCPELLAGLYELLSQKAASDQTMSRAEREIYLVLSMLPVLEMDGIPSLFGELCTLADTIVLELVLRKLGRSQLAGLLGEAKTIYVGGRSAITEAEYQTIDPFASNERLAQLREIEARMLAPGSEIYGDEPLCAYVRAHAAQLI